MTPSPFAQTAVQAFGGLDVVINLVPLEPADLDIAASMADVERLVAAQLHAALPASPRSPPTA